MASITRENLGQLHEKLTVTVAKEDYLPAFEKQLKHFAKTANMPGFRRGNVPVGLVKKMHGQSVLSEQVLRTVEEEMNKYLDQEKLDLFGQALPIEGKQAPDMKVDAPEDYTFEFEIGLKPQLTVDFSKAKLVRYQIEITDAMLTDEVERLRTQFGTLNEMETISDEENVLNFQVKTADENAQPQNNSLIVKHFAEGFRSQLMGKKVGDVVSVVPATDLSDDGRRALMADLKVEDENAPIELEITRIGLVDKAPLTESLFLQAYPNDQIADEEAFRNRVKQDVQAYFQDQTATQLHDQIYHFLVDHVQVDLPDNFMKRWMRLNSEKEVSPEQVETDYPGYSKSLKWSVITNQLVKENNIEVTRQEIERYAKAQLLSYMNMGISLDDDYPWLNDYIAKQMKDQRFVENTFYQIQSTKLFQALESKVSAEEKPISVEAFTDLVKNHHH